MTNELAVMNGGALTESPRSQYDGVRLSGVQQLGTLLSRSGYFADAREMAQAAVKVMAGEELGLAPVASMMGINIIKGKVALSANLMAAQVRRHGYNYRVKRMDNTGCILDFIGKDKSILGESAFTEEDAKMAGVMSDMYKKYPRNMYFSRAMSNGVKWFCPEVTSVLPVYTPEELGARVDGDGEMLNEPAIDTGGHPVGTQAAADAVAQRKIAEMQKPQPQSNVPKSKDYGMLKEFKKIKMQVGSEAYYRVLGTNGYEHADEITSVDKAREVYREMKQCALAQQQPEPAAEMVEQADGDVWPEGRE